MRDLVPVEDNLEIKINRFLSSNPVIFFLLELIYVFLRRNSGDDFFIDFFFRNLAENIERRSGCYSITLY